MTKLILLLSCFLFFTSQKSLFAHPLDEIGDVRVYDQTQTLEIGQEKTTLTIKLTFYALEKIKVWESVDTNRDQELSENEKTSWMRKGQESSFLETSGQRYSFDAVNLNFPSYYDFYSTKPASVSITFETEASVGANQELTYSYLGKDKKLSEITFQVMGRDNIGVSQLTNTSDSSVTFVTISEAGNQASRSKIIGSEKLNSFLDTYVKVDTIAPPLIGVAFLTSFLLGMLHALTPGHGKAIVAGYLVGEKGTIRHAIQLGIIITITHTISVFILGIAALLLTEYVVPATVIYWMNTLSGIVILLFGLYLIKKRLLVVLKGIVQTEVVVKESTEELIPEDTQLNWKNLLPLGISGGVVPCIDALAILIVAISLHKIALGLSLLIAFSLGLACALIVAGILVVIAKKKTLAKVTRLQRYEKYLSLLSAFAVTILGLALLFNKPL
jgi:nickel/cobalt transporter (NicO) family protein